MSMSDWARREVAIACNRENPKIELDEKGFPKTFDYGCSCYGSALKAYLSLMNDDHSGASFGFTKNILIRLMEGKCLTPIEDTDDVWNDVSDKDGKEYQCKRMGALFKRVYDDGRVEYNDVGRTVLIDQKGNSWHSGLASQLVNEMFPITMPYYPAASPYKVYSEEFLVDPKNGDFDTVGLLYIITPKGERVEINRFTAEKDGDMVAITKEEYEERKRNKVEKG